MYEDSTSAEDPVAATGSQFVASVGHEMRTPLHAILGLTELVLESPSLPPELRRYVESISREGDVLRRILDDLLDYSKISAGKLTIQTSAFSPAAIADQAALGVLESANTKGLAFRTDIDPSIPRVVLGDEFRLRQVLTNLLSNAIKYTHTGEVSLRAALVGPDEQIRFQVTDTGPGIPDEALETLFQPFEQARADDARKGTGLGLAISRQLVEAMGGTLSVETSPEGSTFWCDLGFGKARRAIDRETVVATANQSTGIEILVVDDSEVNQALATAQLERLGYRPVVVGSGADALRVLAETTTVQVVLMDWHMPDMDGLETTRRLRGASHANCDVPVIAVTASAMSGDREQCLAAGMNDYLAKPVSLEALASTLQQWIGTDGIEPTPTKAGTAVERTTIENLVTDLGDRAIVAQVVETFLRELPKWEQALGSSLATGDYEAAQRSAHTVKSTAAMLGANELAKTCAAMEAAARDNHAAAHELAPAFRQHAADAKAELEDLHQTLNQAA